VSLYNVFVFVFFNNKNENDKVTFILVTRFGTNLVLVKTHPRKTVI
jgi:hypothetical protein